jgi:hypothetical protein
MTALALIVAGSATTVEAQSGIDLELRGGLAIPVGDLDEVGETGGGFGAGLAYALHERVSFRLDGDLEILSEDLVGVVVMPRTFLWHYHAGLELNVTDPATSSWIVRARGSGGGTTYDTQRFVPDGDDFFDVYPSVAGGLAIGRRWRNSVELGVQGQAFVIFAEKERTAELAGLSPAILNPFREASSFPVGLYLRWVR